MTALEQFDGGALQVLREQMAPEASNGELAYFAEVCNRLDLSPFADQIVLIGRYDRRLGRKVHRHQITVAGRRTLAARTGNLLGIEGPVWCGPRERGELVWREVWDDDNAPPYCARVLVHVRDWVTPANGTAKWSEFLQTDTSGKPLGLWSSMPAHMLGKCAESIALRRAFPDTINADVIGGFTDYQADLDAAHIDAEAETVSVLSHSEPIGPLGEWEPSLEDQGAAHRFVGALKPTERSKFLSRWGIGDFSAAWPPEAVAAVLAGPVEGGVGDTAPAGPTGDDP